VKKQTALLSWSAEFADALRGRRVLVTGATGFIGHALCDALVALGADVHALARSPAPQIDGINRWTVDVRDAARLEAACTAIEPQYVFHLAAQVSARQEIEQVRPMLEHNLLGTVNLLLGLVSERWKCARVVLAGSAEEPTAEPRRAVVASPYTAAKAAASLYARLFQRVYHLPLVVVRPMLTYGPRQESTKLIPYTILKLLRGEAPALSSGSRLCDFVFVSDVVRGLLRAALEPGLEGQTLDLGSGLPRSIRAAVQRIAQLMGSAVPVQFGAIPDRLAERPLLADLQTTRRLLQWEPQWTLEQGLEETIAWYAAREGVAWRRKCA